MPNGSEIRTGLEGAYAPVLEELEDLPSQFIGDVREGRWDLGGILTEDTGTKRSPGIAGDLGDLEMRTVLAERGEVTVVDIRAA